MKAIERHLYSRNGYLYFRSSLPRYLHNPLALKEVVIALGTQDLSEGRMLSVKLSYELEKRLKEFQGHLNELKPEQSPEQTVDQLITNIGSLKNLTGYGFSQSTKTLKLYRPLFSDIVKRYLEDCSNSPRTRQHKENTYILFKEIMGDLVFKEIGLEEARKFKDCLRQNSLECKKALEY